MKIEILQDQIIDIEVRASFFGVKYLLQAQSKDHRLPFLTSSPIYILLVVLVGSKKGRNHHHAFTAHMQGVNPPFVIHGENITAPARGASDLLLHISQSHTPIPCPFGNQISIKIQANMIVANLQPSCPGVARGRSFITRTTRLSCPITRATV